MSVREGDRRVGNTGNFSRSMAERKRGRSGRSSFRLKSQQAALPQQGLRIGIAAAERTEDLHRMPAAAEGQHRVEAAAGRSPHLSHETGRGVIQFDFTMTRVGWMWNSWIRARPIRTRQFG